MIITPARKTQQSQLTPQQLVLGQNLAACTKESSRTEPGPRLPPILGQGVLSGNNSPLKWINLIKIIVDLFNIFNHRQRQRIILLCIRVVFSTCGSCWPRNSAWVNSAMAMETISTILKKKKFTNCTILVWKYYRILILVLLCHSQTSKTDTGIGQQVISAEKKLNI